MERLFVYGTLLDPIIQRTVIGRVVEGDIALLEGYEKKEKAFFDGVYPIVTVSESSTVEGMVLSLTKDELLRCDEYEGSEYTRVRLLLRNGENVWAYLPI